MNMKNLIALAALASSAPSFAGWVSHGNLKVDESSVKFLGNCDDTNSIVDFNSDGSFDLIFTDLEAAANGARATKTCVFKFTGKLPQGRTLAISKVGIAGISQILSEDGTTTATLRHTLAGTVGDAALSSYKFNADHDVQDVVLDKTFDVSRNVWNPCGADVTFKTSINLTAGGANAVINISEAAQKGRTYSIRYYWAWKSC